MAGPIRASVYFGSGGGLPVEGLKSVRIISGEFEHEQCLITLRRVSPDSKRFVSGSPVVVHWGRTPDVSRSFIGYVNHVKPVLGDPNLPEMMVHCVGPTWRMKTAGYRSFRQARVSNVINTIAADHRLSVAGVKPSERVWPVLHQGGKTDWQFLVECAKKEGWTLFVRGTTLYACDYRFAMQRGWGERYLLAPRASGGTTNEFHSSLGQMAPAGGELADRDAYGVNPRSKRVLAHRGSSTGSGRGVTGGRPLSSLVNTAQTDHVFDDLGEVMRDQEASGRENQLTMEATARGPGPLTPEVGSVATVVGFEGRNNGDWFTKKIDIEIGVVEETWVDELLTLGRDVDYTSLVTAQPLQQPPQAGSRLLQGKWVRA